MPPCRRHHVRDLDYSQLGGIIAHLGRNLLPTWPMLPCSNVAKNRHQIALGTLRSAPRHHKTTQRVAKGLFDSPWNFQVSPLQSLLSFFVAYLP